jgi:hypothetical protein
MELIDIERMFFIIATIVGVAFWIIGLYISIILKWDWSSVSARKSEECIKRIVNNFKWDSKSSDLSSVDIGADEKVPLIYFLMIGCMTIGSILISNSFLPFMFVLINIPYVNKALIFLLFSGIILVIVYLFEFVKFLNKLSNECKDLVELELKIDDVSKNLNISLGFIAGIVAFLFILIFVPNVMKYSGNKK